MQQNNQLLYNKRVQKHRKKQKQNLLKNNRKLQIISCVSKHLNYFTNNFFYCI